MKWWWTYVLGFGIGLANISVHIYDDAYVLEFDNGKSMYWIWNWIRSYLLIFAYAWILYIHVLSHISHIPKAEIFGFMFQYLSSERMGLRFWANPIHNTWLDHGEISRTRCTPFCPVMHWLEDCGVGNWAYVSGPCQVYIVNNWIAGQIPGRICNSGSSSLGPEVAYVQF